MITWWLNKQKQKRMSKLKRKRRIFEHQAEPLVDALLMKHKIQKYQVKTATINEYAPAHVQGEQVSILFFGRILCEVQLTKKPEVVFFLPTNQLTFSISDAPNYTIVEGQYVCLNQDIKSDDELSGVLGEKEDELLIIKIEEEAEYPYWGYSQDKKEALRLKKSEFDMLDKRVPVEII